MRLDSAAFLVVFAIFFVGYSAAPSRWKRVLLVVGSVAFYATLSLRYVPLLLALGVFTFAIASRIPRASSPRRRDHLLWLGVGVNVATLAFFKIAAPTAGALSALGLEGHAHLFEIAVPLGLSFYALQAISCLVDVHRGLYEPPRSLLSFLASFTLFPHLMAGPIVRSSFLVPLVEKVETVRWETARRALLLFVVGYAKKVVADKLAPSADAAFDASHAVSALEAWTSLIAYAGQLYGDFSGYTDMATALALLLGLDLPPNFDLPYLATSPADFWRRWHISLSTWLRDYVYLPLGMRFRRRRYLSILVTWMVAGLWHGVSSVFLLYGFYHGVLLAGTDWLTRRFERDEAPSGLRRLGQTVLTFYLVLMGYVVFRSHTLRAAVSFFFTLHASRIPSKSVHDSLTMLAIAAGAIVFTHLLDFVTHHRRAVVERAWILWPALAVTFAILALFGGEAHPFLYFAF